MPPDRCNQKPWNQRINMNRRKLLASSAALGLASAIPFLSVSKLFAATGAVQSGSSADKNQLKDRSNPLTPPAQGSIPVAFPISRGAVIIDFCGPWEVFEAADVPGHQGQVPERYQRCLQERCRGLDFRNQPGAYARGAKASPTSRCACATSSIDVRPAL